ncbi:hypothetical protein Acr_27g0001130 [Actinidia rufa]|uniref:Uncharacterized protein n=1 Tax=Actinidia rufa TaxID=165716 RepID=A0A7J0H6K8_9ERIC|nr:hypothetical protein Acr_27g0001130 [Actinidia rufa]
MNRERRENPLIIATYVSLFRAIAVIEEPKEGRERERYQLVIEERVKERLTYHRSPLPKSLSIARVGGEMLRRSRQCKRRGTGRTRRRPEAADEERSIWFSGRNRGRRFGVISTVEDLEIMTPMKGPDLVVAILEDLIGKGNFGWKRGGCDAAR